MRKITQPFNTIFFFFLFLRKIMQPLYAKKSSNLSKIVFVLLWAQVKIFSVSHMQDFDQSYRAPAGGPFHRRPTESQTAGEIFSFLQIQPVMYFSIKKRKRQKFDIRFQLFLNNPNKGFLKEKQERLKTRKHIFF